MLQHAHGRQLDSDINYAENGKRVIPAGTPLKATSYGRYRVYVELPDGKQAIGNDYSTTDPQTRNLVVLD